MRSRIALAITMGLVVGLVGAARVAPRDLQAQRTVLLEVFGDLA